jgi:hypothetical protein
MLGIMVLVLVLLSQQAVPPEAIKPAQAEQPVQPVQDKRTELNLLGTTDAAVGESRRNENIQFNLIDNNTLKYLNIRLGTNANIVTEFLPERKYFGTEFGNNPTPTAHLKPLNTADAFHGRLSFSRSDSIFSARSFFQVGAVQPAHENDYGFVAGVQVWRAAHLTIEGNQQALQGNVNGNVLVPLASERTPLATDPAVRRLIQRWIDAYPNALPNRPDIDPRALNTNSPQTINTEASNIRLDQSFGPRNRIFAQHAFTNQKVHAFELVAGQNPDTNTKSHSARITWDHTVADRSLLDLTLGFDRVHSLLTPEPNAVGPQVVIGNSYQSLGPGATIPIDRRISRFRQAVLYRHSIGNHHLSVGGEIDRLRNNGLESSSERGNYYFRSDFGHDAITNFRMGMPSRYSVGIGNGYRSFRWFEQQFFAGDVWKVRPNLALITACAIRRSPARAKRTDSRLSILIVIAAPLDRNSG